MNVVVALVVAVVIVALIVLALSVLVVTQYQVTYPVHRDSDGGAGCTSRRRAHQR